MADFDVGTVAALAQQRLNETTADCETQGQALFHQALSDQRTMMGHLLEPIGPLMQATAKRASVLAESTPVDRKTPPNQKG